LPAAIVTLWKDQVGGAFVESGLLVPLLLMSLFGTVEFSRALWTLNALHYSVQEAARCASINTAKCVTVSQIQSFAAEQSGLSFDPSVFSVTPSCGNQVAASFKMQLHIPFVLDSLTLTAQSCYPI